MQNFAHISNLPSCKLDLPSSIWQNAKDLIQIEKVAFLDDTLGFIPVADSECTFSDNTSSHLCGAEERFVQGRGDKSIVRASSGMYSCGITIVALLMWGRPFSRTSVFHLHCDPPFCYHWIAVVALQNSLCVSKVSLQGMGDVLCAAFRSYYLK